MTTVHSIVVQSRIDIPFRTSTTLPHLYKAPPSSPNWTYYVLTIKSQLLPQTSPKQLLQHHLASSSLCECHSASAMPHTFQRFMDQVLRGIQSAYVYIDDILIASPTPAQHLKDLRSVFERLAAHSMVINPNKCRFGVSELDFLGHHITKHGITPLPEKVQAVQNFPQPQSPWQLRQFIGLVNFYHRFLPHCAELMQPLHTLLSSARSNSKTLTWNDVALAAFTATKDALANASSLSYPKGDAPTCLMTDASDTAVGAVLQQHIHGTWYPISFFSKMTPAETRYSTFDSVFGHKTLPPFPRRSTFSCPHGS